MPESLVSLAANIVLAGTLGAAHALSFDRTFTAGTAVQGGILGEAGSFGLEFSPADAHEHRQPG